jgi:Zn-dependent protease
MAELSTIQKIIVMAPPFVFSVILHEIAHGWIAEKFGDPTARNAGRLTLNPIPHIDLIWTIIMPVTLYISTGGSFVVGGAKPVPINPNNFRNPKRDMALSSLAGPGANIVIAIFCAILLRLILPLLSSLFPEDIWQPIALPIELMLSYAAFISIVLAVFNMIPIPPLDGSRILYWLLPDKLAMQYYRLERFGLIILLALIAFRVISAIMWPIISYVAYFILGENVLAFLIHYFFKT